MMPPDTPSYMAPAWAACMSWALGNDEVRQDFETATGHRYEPPKNGLDAAIDKATGHGEAYVRAFIKWANVNVWGPMDTTPATPARSEASPARTTNDGGRDGRS